MLSKATGNGIPEGDKHRLWLLVMAEPVSPGEGMEGWFRLGAEGSIGFIPSSCAVGPQGVSSGMISGSSEGSDLY